jgi:hypothetical protein
MAIHGPVKAVTSCTSTDTDTTRPACSGATPRSIRMGGSQPNTQ